MSKIIKQVKLTGLPIVINNLCLTGSAAGTDTDEPATSALKPASHPDLTVLVEAKVAAIVSQARREMEEESVSLYEHSKKTGFTEGKELGYQDGRNAGYTEGKDAGYAEGFAQGEAAAAEKMKSAVLQATEEAAKIIAEANRQAQQTVLASEKQILDIALAIAQKILAAEIDANSQAVVAIVKNTMDKVRDQRQIIVRVNPADFGPVIAAKHELEAILQREQSVEFAADQTVSRGGCVIDSAFGSADARLETQLQAIESVIRSLLP